MEHHLQDSKYADLPLAHRLGRCILVPKPFTDLTALVKVRTIVRLALPSLCNNKVSTVKSCCFQRHLSAYPTTLEQDRATLVCWQFSVENEIFRCSRHGV